MKNLIEKVHQKWRSASLSAFRILIHLNAPMSQHQIADKLDISPGHARYLLKTLEEHGFVTSKLEKSPYTEHKVRIYRPKKAIQKEIA